MDLLLGQFADSALAAMSDADLEAFESLMEVPDRDLFAWITGKQKIPANYDSPVFRQVLAFHIGDHTQ